MDKTDYEMIFMQLEITEPEIMKRMREGVFTQVEAGYIIYGIGRTIQDQYKYKDFFQKLSYISKLVEYIMEVEDEDSINQEYEEQEE